MSRNGWLALAGSVAIAAVALAQTAVNPIQYRVTFGGKTATVAGITVVGKLALSSKPLAGALGSSLSVDFKGKTATFTRNAKTAKVAVSVQKDIAYAPVLEVTKGLGLTVAVSGSTVAVTNPAPSAPTNAPSVQGTAQPSVQGTTQQSGGEGVVGQTYTLCKGQDSAINYQITRLEYSVGNYLYDGGDKDDTLGPDKKALLIYFTVQNPLSSEVYLSGDKIRFSGVDSKNQNVQGDGYWYEQGTLRPISTTLRPAQKLSAFTRIILDTDVSLPKLIVDDCNNTVWRYDLRGKVQGVPAPISDPKVQDGSGALQTFPAQLGAAYPARMGSFRVDRVEFSDKPWFDGSNPPEGGRWLIVYFTVKNATRQAQGLGESALSFVDQDGVVSPTSNWLYRASRDATPDGVSVPAGGELGLRALAEVPAGAEVKKVRLTYFGSRTAEIDASALR
jgi:hypothetical protein